MGNIIFNITVCIIGILILIVHFVSLVMKKNKRNDEKWLLLYILFTIIHFSIYLCFSFVKLNYTSDNYIIIHYTLFYIMINLEVLLLFRYMMFYNFSTKKLKIIMRIINLLLFLIFISLDIINIFTGIFFHVENGEYIRSNWMIVSQGYQFLVFFGIIIVALTNKKANYLEKIAVSFFSIFPLLSIIVQNYLKGYAINYASIIISVEIIFFYISHQKSVQLAEKEEMNKEVQIKLMLSQIQPHFIYNSLSSISTLISIDPEKAQKSLDDFTEYLRRNLSSLTETKLIPFEDELRHIETYVSLEKLRFNNRLNVIYDIGTTDFLVPPLSIQPLVENAIKHGVLKKIEGGDITITTFELDSEYVVEIKDDGVGFDISNINFEQNQNFGLKNINYRIHQMCNGYLTISSKKDVGTKITVKFKK